MNFETIYLDAKQNETIYHTLCWNRVRLQSMNRLGKQIFVHLYIIIRLFANPNN